MKKLISLFIVFATLAGVTLGKTVYVNANHPANGDGTSWSSPYTNLQIAVDAAAAGDLVLVTNGVYSPITTGNKAITIQSVNGAEVTIIDGNGTDRCATLGTSASHTNTVLNGFTVTNGFTTGNGGGSIGGTLTGCTISGNTANSNGGGSYGGTLTGCTISGNTANYGGGSNGGTLTDCVISGNTANYGGGSNGGTLTDCVISNNVTTLYDGGGTHNSIVTNCTISGNTANRNGGGALSGTLIGCTISGNTANSEGGGVYGGNVYGSRIFNNVSSGRGGGIADATICVDSDIYSNQSRKTSYAGGGSAGTPLYRCRIYGNIATNGCGGGVILGSLFSCIVSNNIAIRGGGAADCRNANNSLIVRNRGGGTYYGTYRNCVISYNTTAGEAGALAGTWNGTYQNCIVSDNTNLASGTVKNYASQDAYTFSSTVPLITGYGNNDSDPQFTDPANNDFTLLPTSPCINKGANQYVTTTTDLLGSLRIKDWRVDMGAYESQSTRFVTTPNALFPMGTKDVK